MEKAIRTGSRAGPPSAVSIDAEALAGVIRELPIGPDEAERLAQAIESSSTNVEFLASALSAVRSVIERLEPVPPHEAADPALGID